MTRRTPCLRRCRGSATTATSCRRSAASPMTREHCRRRSDRIHTLRSNHQAAIGAAHGHRHPPRPRECVRDNDEHRDRVSADETTYDRDSSRSRRPMAAAAHTSLRSARRCRGRFTCKRGVAAACGPGATSHLSPPEATRHVPPSACAIHDRYVTSRSLAATYGVPLQPHRLGPTTRALPAAMTVVEPRTGPSSPTLMPR